MCTAFLVNAYIVGRLAKPHVLRQNYINVKIDKSNVLSWGFLTFVHHVGMASAMLAANPIPSNMLASLRGLDATNNQGHCAMVERDLDEQSIDQLDRELDSVIPGLTLLHERRDRALLHVLNVADAASHDVRYKAMALHFAIVWIHKYCRTTSGKSDLVFRKNLLHAAESLLKQAASFVYVEHVMRILRKKLGTGRRRGCQVGMILADNLNSGMAAAETILFAPEDPTIEIELPMTHSDLTELIEEAQPEIKGRRVTYHFPFAGYRKWHEGVAPFHADMWQLEASWEIHGYRLEDWRKVWSSIASFSAINRFLNMISLTFGSDSRLQNRPRRP